VNWRQKKTEEEFLSKTKQTSRRVFIKAILLCSGIPYSYRRQNTQPQLLRSIARSKRLLSGLSVERSQPCVHVRASHYFF
jgi:hypothetical protein